MVFDFRRITFSGGGKKPGRSNPAGPTKLRSVDYKLTEHHHGKSKVRVLRVRQVQLKSLLRGSARCSAGGAAPRRRVSRSPCLKTLKQPRRLHDSTPPLAPPQDGARHTVQHYDVATRLYSPVTDVCYTEGDNSQLVATDTQRNTVYIVAKRSKVRTTFLFALLLPRTASCGATPRAHEDTTPPDLDRSPSFCPTSSAPRSGPALPRLHCQC